MFADEEKIAGQLTDKLCKMSETFEVTLDVNGTGTFATHDATGTIHRVLRARYDGQKWTATGPLAWENVAIASKVGCPYIDILTPVVTWTVLIVDEGDGLSMRWERSGNEGSTASIDCPPDGGEDPPPIPGQPGTALLNTGVEPFLLPYTGGTVPFTGGFQDGGDGFVNTGTIKVKPIGITPPG